MLADLHTHSTASDGSYSPNELLHSAAGLGLRKLAITDHDVITWSAGLVRLAARLDVDLIAGVELTTKFEGRSVHLLGYFPSGAAIEEFRRWLEAIHATRHDRNERLVRRLKELDVHVTLEEAARHADGVVARPHFARVMVDKGYAVSLRDAFDRYLGETAPGYVEREAPDIGEAIGRMRDAGAISSLAHPLRLGAADVGRVIAGFAEHGLDAIEAFHPDHSEADAAGFVALARSLGLAVTGGSDFHGTNKPGVELGCDLPDWVIDDLARLDRSLNA